MTTAKHAVKVTIGGEDYTVRSELPPEYTREVAAYVDAALRRIRDMMPMVESHKAAILAALAITDELFQARRGDREHAARMHDQERPDRQRDFFDVGIGEAIARGLGRQHAAVEHVEARGGDVALSLETKGRRQDECGGQCAPQCSAKHRIPQLLFES